MDEISNELDKVLDELKSVTKQLMSFSLMISTMTLVNIGFSLALTIYITVAVNDRYSFYSEFRLFFILISVGILIGVILALVMYDRMISKGDGIYQEISDELEWHVRQDATTLHSAS